MLVHNEVLIIFVIIGNKGPRQYFKSHVGMESRLPDLVGLALMICWTSSSDIDLKVDSCAVVAICSSPISPAQLLATLTDCRSF